jgi:tetratricopeptide (TPR) repeat protein
LLRTLSVIAWMLLLVAPGGAGEGIKPGRMVQVRSPLGGVALYLPAGHDPAKSWPAVIFLPSRERPAQGWLKLWRKVADRDGLVVALPVPSKPDVSAGYPAMAPVIIARAALAAAQVDRQRVAIVGHRSGGFGLMTTIINYPRLARAAVIIGSVPPPLRPRKELARRMPPVLFLCENRRVRQAIDSYAKQSTGLRLEVRKLAAAEGPFETRFAAEAARWIGRQFPTGGRTPAKVLTAEKDQEKSAALQATASALRARGADAGAYVQLLAANRLAARPFEARMALARICLEGRRLTEAVEWADEAALADPGNPSPHIVAARALLKMGKTRPALARLERAGKPGKELKALLEKRSAALEKTNLATAFSHYSQAIEHLRAGRSKQAAAAARSAVRAAPMEASYRAFAAQALAATEGLETAEKSLADYLELFPHDAYIGPLAASLALTRKTDYTRAASVPAVSLSIDKILPVGAASGFLTAMARKGGYRLSTEEFAKKLTAAGANRMLLRALPLLRQQGIAFGIGRGSREDLQRKLKAGVAVLVQMPPGGLAGLRAQEKFNSGVPRLVTGYDDRAKCFLVQDYGVAGPVRIPYALFDRLWASLDRWWLAVVPTSGKMPGNSGGLTATELATAMAENRDLRAAREMFASALKSSPERANLGLGTVLAGLGKYAEARKHLARLKGGGPDIQIQVACTLGGIEERGSVGTLAEKIERALPHYARAWNLDPGNERSLLQLCAALMTRGRPGDLVEARRKLEDFLRYRPTSLPCLRLLYAR